MLFQIFARERKTGEYTAEPFYINSEVDDVDTAFELADKQFGEYFQIKTIIPEGRWIESDSGVAPPYQRHDAIADAIMEDKKREYILKNAKKETGVDIEFLKPEAMQLIFK